MMVDVLGEYVIFTFSVIPLVRAEDALGIYIFGVGTLCIARSVWWAMRRPK